MGCAQPARIHDAERAYEGMDPLFSWSLAREWIAAADQDARRTFARRLNSAAGAPILPTPEARVQNPVPK